ncbi:MAG: BBP7 family outer membrane beta-barrel protein [Planctomycetes bacterium]|nr:BBP7 family outer membrane beta-barrel protein [Planctomycetota bacterium]
MGKMKKLLVMVAVLALTANRVSAQVPSVRSLRPTTLEAEGFRGAVFASPTPNRGIVQASGQQVLPGDNTVQRADLVEPAEQPDASDPMASPRAEDFVFGGNPCVLPWRFWGGAEVLLGMSRPVPVVPVVTTGPAVAGLLNAGAIGQPGTVPLFGGRHMLGDWRGGLRAEGGMWFDAAQNNGVTARFYSLYSTSDQLVGAGNGTNVVNVPQFVSVGGLIVQIPAPVGFPGLTTGTVSTTAQTMFAGGDLNLRRMMQQGRRVRFDALVGYRQLYLHDELGADFTVVGALPPPLVAVASGGDNIRTQNHFFGPNLGLVASTVGKRWTLEALGAVAIGVNVSDLDFRRNLLATATGVPRTPIVLTNVHDPMTYFGTVAEAGFKVGFRLGEHAKLTFGYSGLYWNNVRRAQEQLTLSPTLTGNTTYYFAHMLTCGAEVRY